MADYLLLPAALGSAMPLMMINFGNRYTTLATLIRKIHSELMAKKLTKKDKESNIYLKQIVVLRKRLTLNRITASIAATAFLCNLISLYFGYTNSVTEFGYCFTLGITLFSIAIVLYIVELQLATNALDTHLQDLEEL
jgi:hypothetical protein|tara:strand:+ start:935 stop:1348 length:414 start_codon:yes stop_codon:yes gene_type:complete